MMIEKEIWKEIPGYKGCYLASSLGSIKRKGKILSPSKSGRYLHVHLSVDGHRTTQTIHRLIALTFVTNTNNYPCVNHKNGNRSDNRAENLEWCTHSMNSRHAVRTGLLKFPSGTNCVHSKLTREEVKEIRELNKSGRLKYMKIAKHFPKVCYETIKRVCQNKSYKEDTLYTNKILINDLS